MNTNTVSFYLNGKPVTLENPEPGLLLIDYLRSPGIGLTGAKKGCGQGGCGACTVILSRTEPDGQLRHRAINACLRPVCSLQGLAVTTIEGTGSARRPQSPLATGRKVFSFSAAPLDMTRDRQQQQERPRQLKLAAAGVASAPRKGHPLGSGIADAGMNPVAYRLAENNGTQCGYCTTGFVMNMSAFLADRREQPTKREIENIFDGNICRCTGYRPILTGMKTFAADWSAEDEARRMKCLMDAAGTAQPVSDSVRLALPAAQSLLPGPLALDGGAQAWFSPATLDDLRQLLQRHQGSRIRLIHGNTSFGIYPDEFRRAEVLISIARLAELADCRREGDSLVVGAGTSYSRLIELLDTDAGENPQQDEGRAPRNALLYMARRTAGTIVRNAASIGGNSMLVLQHIHARGEGDGGAPFPSDLLTALAAVEAEIEGLWLSTGAPFRLRIEDLIDKVAGDSALPADMLLLRYHLPLHGDGLLVHAAKVALREVNAHSIVNMTSALAPDAESRLREVRLVFGGIAPYPWRASATENALRGKPLRLEEFPELAGRLGEEVAAELRRWSPRMQRLPDEGFNDEYRVQLCQSLLYKALINAQLRLAPEAVPAEVRSSGVEQWGAWPLSDGLQRYKAQSFKRPVSQPYVKFSALQQASGQVHYTHELALPPLGVNAAFVQSRRALARFHYRLPAEGGGEAGRGEAVDIEQLKDWLARRFPAFITLITWRDIPPGGQNLQGMGADQPLFAEERVSYVGQAIALVIAPDEQQAVDIAHFVSEHCVAYEQGNPWNDDRVEPRWYRPILSLPEAIAAGSVFPDCPVPAPYVSHIWKITRPGSRFDWLTPGKDPLDRDIVRREARVDGAPAVVVESTQSTGSQIHFYMETQACLAIPRDNDCLRVHPSSQSPAAMHETVASAIHSEHNHVEISICQLGGGYGGKTEQARFVAGPAAVAAKALQRPVRLVLPREEDSLMIGKRHAYYGQYQIAVDSGADHAGDKGIIRGFNTRMWGDGGAFYDCSFIVSNCIQTRADNAYRVRNFENTIDVCRTNTAPNTAFRSFGDLQSTVILENAIDDAAFAIGMCPAELREKNLYERGDVTPFGQALGFCYIREVWDYLKQTCRFEEKKREVESFNRANKWRKRGVYMVPVKYGSGYNLSLLEQASAVISIYHTDGSIVIHQGGVDMGQGMMTKLEQIAAYILNLPLSMIRIESANTSVIPNPTSTGGSTGTAYNGDAVKRVCEELRGRLMEFGYRMLKELGDEACRDLGIDFWNHPEGWLAEADMPEQPTNPLIWQNLVSLAYEKRVGLIASFNAPIPGGSNGMAVTTYKPWTEQQPIPGIELPPEEERRDKPVSGQFDEFVGFTYSAACALVEVDILTGEVKVLSADIVYDMGWSINPALDIGQVEGAFVQGIGYMLSEKLVFQPDGPEQGRLNSTNTWTYKPPAITTIPLEMNVHLFPRDAAKVPDNPNELLSSKEVGEPPMVLATSVFLAVKAAVRASRLERGLDGLFRLDAPATVQEVRRACDLSFTP